ncbi:MAG: PIG-L family deacetylase [Chloroflexota bacterium]
MTENKKMLVVLAHPDDESFGMGGTIAYYTSQGVEVTLICATRGEVGTVDPEFMDGYNSIGELREAELRCAGKILGLKDIILLDYRDSGMVGSEDNQHPQALAAQDIESVAEKVIHYIRDIRPQVVVTFDPVGGYHHPDHIAIHKATVRAFEAAGKQDNLVNGQDSFQPERLYYMVFSRKFLRFVVKFLRLIGRDPTKFGRNNDLNLEMMTRDPDLPQHISISYRRVTKQKTQADACHASQNNVSSQSPIWARVLLALSRKKDHFMQAFPIVPEDYRQSDLFSK